MANSEAPEQTSNQRINSLEAFSSYRYHDIDLNRLTIYAIALLRDMGIPTSIENIAVANFRLFPERFSMPGYPQFPDISRVNRALLQLRPKYRNWATGTTRRGWSLTVAGQSELVVVQSRLASTESVNPISPKSIEDLGKRTLDVHAEIRRIRESNLYKKALAGWSDISSLEVFDVLDAYTHTPASVLRRKLRELKQSAADANDLEVQQFLAEIGDRFQLLFAKK